MPANKIKKVILATAPRAGGEIEMAGLPFLGVGYLASYLEKNGYEVKIVDTHKENLNESEMAEKIMSFEPEAVGVSANTHNRFRAIEAIKLLKKKNPNLLVVVGGPHFSLTDKDALAVVPEIDVVVRSEGEVAFEELLSTWPDRERLKNILGITYRDENGRIVANANRPFLMDWSELPFPSWHLYNLSEYRKQIHGTDFRTIGVISARGCPNHCTFCASPDNSVMRLRSAKNFVDELEFLNKKYGFEGFNFWDDTLTVIKSRVMEICQEIIDRKLDIKWYARARVNTVDKEMIDMMKKAGCIRISFGVESGSPRVLAVVKKNIDLSQVDFATRICSEAGLVVSLNFMVNLPTETMEDLRMTADLIKKLKKIPRTEVGYGFSLIYPGTEMEVFAKENGILPKNFSWNSPFQTKKYKMIGADPGIPYMEWPGKELEVVKSFMVKNLMDRGEIFNKTWRKLKKIKSWSELISLVKAGAVYLRSK
ncbi:MAG: radical SAM protein [Patescibacteria group bacterium]